MELTLLDQHGKQVDTLRRVLSATLTDRLSGERTLEFSTLTARCVPIVPGMQVCLEGQYYNIVRVCRRMTNGFPVASVSCEHISYLLNDEAYDLVTFVYEGSAKKGLQKLLEGTPFQPGVVEQSTPVEVALTEGTITRRSALMKFIDACGCEVEYDGCRINLRKHRGSQTRKQLMDGTNVTDLTVTLDSREGTAAYEISLYQMAELETGDEVNITFRPMGVNVDTRIIGITYDPFYRRSVRVEVGDSVPNLLASTSRQLDQIKQEFRAADGQLTSTIENVSGEMSSLSQTADKINWLVRSGSSSSDFTMTDRAIQLMAEGIDLNGYVTFSALQANGQTKIHGGNITTGLISADRIDVDAIKVRTIYSSSDSTEYAQMLSTGLNIYTNKDAPTLALGWMLDSNGYYLPMLVLGTGSGRQGTASMVKKFTNGIFIGDNTDQLSGTISSGNGILVDTNSKKVQTVQNGQTGSGQLRNIIVVSAADYNAGNYTTSDGDLIAVLQ